MRRRRFVTSSLTASAALLAGSACRPSSPADTPAAQAGQFVHCVYFWMRDDLSDADRATFEQGLETLKNLDSVTAGYVGTPPPGERDIVDDSFDYALVLAFADTAGHDAYQEHPDHETFRQQTVGFWRDIKIYDMLT